MSAAPAPRTARERVRTELINEIKAVARRHVAEHGSAALSLRAVARDVGMVSSAVYRYFPSRDQLLTELIVDAYVAFGAAVTDAEAAVRRHDHVGRWMAACTGARTWAIASPQEFALIFGSPVPGYSAPVDTIDPAAIAPLVLLGIAADAATARRGRGAEPSTPVPVPVASPMPIPMPKALRTDLRGLATITGVGLDEHVLARCLMAWTQLVGSISFELFGHLHNVVNDDDAYFSFQMRGVARELGLDS